MSQIIKIKNSTTPGSRPSALQTGELAVNVTDGTLLFGDVSSVSDTFKFGQLTVTGDTTVTGNILVDGTVDGIDIATDVAANTIKETDKNYVHTQSALATAWVVTHNLEKNPSVTVVDSAGTVVIGQVDYDSLNQVTLTFKATFSGKAYCN